MSTYAAETAELTDTVVLDLLARAVAERGRDYRYRDHYPRYEYTDPEANPACLIGLALNRYGVPRAALHTWDDSVPEVFGHTYPVGGALADVPQFATMRPSQQGGPNFDGVPPATEPAIRLLWAAQIVQDSDATWGQALDAARTLHDQPSDHAHDSSPAGAAGRA